MYTEVCRHCGTYKKVDTWAQDPEDGEQGLTSVRYEDADVDSEMWVYRLALMDAREEAENEDAWDAAVAEYHEMDTSGDLGYHYDGVDNDIPDCDGVDDRIDDIQELVANND